MTTPLIFLQRCMLVLVIFLYYVHARSEKADYGVVDCERYPFHHTCRGMMSKKRAMLINTVQSSGCDRGDLDCIKTKILSERAHRLSYLPIPRSKLWISLLNDDSQRDFSYDVYPLGHEGYHKKRKNAELDQQLDERRTPMMENFLSELELSDNDY